MLIYLLGYMGSGKTTLGKELAKLMHYRFIDLDKIIVDKQGKSINSLFEEHGEKHFRVLEQEALRDTFGFERTIISTGGGTPCFFENMKEINEHGLSVFLEVPIATLAERLSRNKHSRPLIKEKSREELEEYIKDGLKSRQGYYDKAALKIDASTVNANLLERIIKSYPV